MALWLKNRTPTTIELLQPLSPVQRDCAKQILDGNNLIFIEQQAHSNNVAIGYVVNQDFYTAIFSASQSGDCRIEFNEKAFDCYDYYLAEYCHTDYSGLKPHKIEQVELTGSPPLEVYVWFDVLGLGGRGAAKHRFFVEQADGSFKPILTLNLCRDLNSLEIKSDSQTISATDDLVCDEFEGRKEHIDYSLLNGTAKPLHDWLDP